MKGTGTRGKAITPEEQARINTLRRKVAHYNERCGTSLYLHVLNTAEKPVEREGGEIRLALVTPGGSYQHIGSLLDLEHILRIEPVK